MGSQGVRHNWVIEQQQQGSFGFKRPHAVSSGLSAYTQWNALWLSFLPLRPQRRNRKQNPALFISTLSFMFLVTACLCSSRWSHVSPVEAWLRAGSAPVTDQTTSSWDDTDAREVRESGLISASESTPKFSNMFTFTYFRDSKPLLLWFLFSPTASHGVSWVMLQCFCYTAQVNLYIRFLLYHSYMMEGSLVS